MKNCEPLEAGPALAILSVYGRSCLSVGWNSSSNSPPQMLSPPMPVPVGSPVWIMKPYKQQKTEGFGEQKAAWIYSTEGRFSSLTLMTLWNMWLL